MGTTDEVLLTYLVPAHNSGQMIEGTLKELRDHLSGKKAEIVVVENGSSDNTLELLRQVEADWEQGDVRLRVLQSANGLGNALKHGIISSRGARIFLGADDLPFGFGDLDKAMNIDHAEHPVVIGSKGHPESQAGRGLVRAVLTFGFLSVRWVVLGMRTRDPQGTFALWYPIKLRRALQPFYRRAATIPAKSVMLVELLVRRDDSPLRMNGSGLLLLNAPWKIEQTLQPVGKLLADTLGEAGATSRVEFLRRPD